MVVQEAHTKMLQYSRMRHFGQTRRQDPLPIFARRASSVILLIVAAFLAGEVWEVYEKERISAASRAEAETKLQDLKIREARLRADIAGLKTERGVEEALRREYGFGKQGEGLIVLIEHPTAAPETPRSWPIRLFQSAFEWW